MLEIEKRKKAGGKPMHTFQLGHCDVAAAYIEVECENLGLRLQEQKKTSASIGNNI